MEDGRSRRGAAGPRGAAPGRAPGGDVARRILAASSPGGRGQTAVTRRGEDRSFVRAENEDDDGYDPYSDRPASGQTWEEDPWS